MSATEQGLNFRPLQTLAGSDIDTGEQSFAAAAIAGTARMERKGIKRNQHTPHLRTTNPGPPPGPDSSHQSAEQVRSQMLEDRSGGGPLASSKNRALNPTRFLCRSEVRNFLLEYARGNRSHKFERVSEETLVAINEFVRQKLVDHVRRLPSKGKTI